MALVASAVAVSVFQSVKHCLLDSIGPGLASLVCKYVLQPRLIVATDGDVGSVGLTNYNILLNTDGGTSADSPDNEPINQQEAALEGVVEKSASPPAQVVRPVAPLSETNNIMPVAPLSETNNIMPLQLYWGDTEHVAQALDLLVHPALVAPIAANPIPPPGQLDEAAANVTPGDHDSSPRNGYDVVFMSDIVALVYTDAFDSLLTTMKQLCKATTVLYLVYKRRHSSEAQFFEKLAESKAFEVVKLARSTIHGDFRHLPIFIYRLRPLFL